jgi:hypothetical protein
VTEPTQADRRAAECLHDRYSIDNAARAIARARAVGRAEAAADLARIRAAAEPLRTWLYHQCRPPRAPSITEYESLMAAIDGKGGAT